mmetsp:Transcript_11326/g.41443  ORF Transcript_11326/g.41443 Transcript_11326/m.41443 type:complete len:330 (-) Transcript_11326:64-1053(-)
MVLVENPVLRTLSSNLARSDSVKSARSDPDAEPKPSGPIEASAERDPGYIDYFGAFAEDLKSNGDKPMSNVHTVPNTEGKLVAHYEDHPVPDQLIDFNCSWQLADHKRNFCLIVSDMQKEYVDHIDYVLPNTQTLVEKFREMKLPIVWTNWAHKLGDGFAGALDRYVGSEGIAAKANISFVFKEDGDQTVDMLAPQTEDEKSRVINSLHFSKFADLDANGREILYPMLQAWGVNTLVVVGAWTDACIAGTVFDAADRYGYDVVAVTDGIASSTTRGGTMLDCLTHVVSKPCTCAEVVSHLSEHPELVEAPKARLHGNVRFTKTDLVCKR